MDSLKSLIESYEKWVAANPETVSDVETTAKWLSYFVAGRISDSNVVSELMYSLSNMVVLYNDRIIVRSHKPVTNDGSVALKELHNAFCYRLKVMLTTLEYCEVFIEISAKRLFGTKGRWIFVVILQLMKATGRYFILKHSTERIITSPAMPSLNRRTFVKQQRNNIENNKPLRIGDEHSFTFQLKRSGRTVRKVENAPPIQYRDFNIQAELQEHHRNAVPKTLLHAEYIYIAKPLIHLAAMGVFGEQSWKQYIVSLALDLTSIRLYHKNRHLMTKQQKLEMSRRCHNLLLYLMRSPFYDNFTQTRLERILGFVANNMPIGKMIATPLLDYIPHWQNTYFYLWST